ncbi:MAG: putative GTPase [Acidimicrobiales bacterium]|jgi:predicted GTPase
MSSLINDVRAVLTDAERVFSALPEARRLALVKERLDGPLRVAIAGKVKAGKSTLLNALVGERLAPTDTGECTKIVTWYRDGHTYQVLLHPVGGGEPTQARFHRDDGAIEVDLAGADATDFERIDVSWPSLSLRTMTLIDTPGVGSLSEGIANRAFEFLDPEEDETPADAVLYLMKHIHASDLNLLEAFHDTTVSQPNPVNAVAVLSRADEIGAGRLDSMASANKIATRYGDDGRLRRLVQIVVPVAGLLAESAETLTEWEFKALRQLADFPEADLEPYLLSADRFVEARPETPLTSLEREQLLSRFGLFGVRLSLALLRRNVCESSAELSDELIARSGLNNLQTILSTLFMDRSEVLKARSALLAVERLCTEHPAVDGVATLLASIEQIMAGAHPFNELTTMAAVRSGWVKGKTTDLAEVEQLLGSGGTAPWQRLGLDDTATPDELRTAAIESLSRWQRKAENPLTSLDLVTAARVVIRTLEGLITA